MKWRTSSAPDAPIAVDGISVPTHPHEQMYWVV
jgi:hypothetical protein